MKLVWLLLIFAQCIVPKKLKLFKQRFCMSNDITLFEFKWKGQCQKLINFWIIWLNLQYCSAEQVLTAWYEEMPSDTSATSGFTKYSHLSTINKKYVQWKWSHFTKYSHWKPYKNSTDPKTCAHKIPYISYTSTPLIMHSVWTEVF